MLASDLNALLRTESGNLEINELVTGEVIIPAGCQVRRLTATVNGRVIAGGYSVPNAPRFLVEKSGSFEIHNKTGERRELNTELTRYSGVTVVLRDMEMNLWINSNESSAFYGLHLMDCTLNIHANGAAVNGVLLKECRDCFLTGSASEIGLGTEPGSGYGFGISSCFNCTVVNSRFDKVRYGVSLSQGGRGNHVSSIRGYASVALVDVHGATFDPRFTDINNSHKTGLDLKLGNESWGTDITGEYVSDVEKVKVIQNDSTA